MTVDCRKWVAGLVVVLAAVAVAVASSFEPCDPSTQVYYGVTTKENDVQILCVDISNGSSRLFYDITGACGLQGWSPGQYDCFY